MEMKKNKSLVVFLIFLVCLIIALSPFKTNARLVECSSDPCSLCDLFKTMQNVLNFIVSPKGGIVFALAVIGIMIGGILIMVAGANTKLYSLGISFLKAAFVGLVIALVAWVIVNTILLLLTGSNQPPGFPWPWNEIRC